ncbi:MAG: hypothetical protein MZV49_23320 [Rhodopseudomonas palustris]|nr:hypothetical protein [Rhodopseudomonas palustris]
MQRGRVISGARIAVIGGKPAAAAAWAGRGRSLARCAAPALAGPPPDCLTEQPPPRPTAAHGFCRGMAATLQPIGANRAATAPAAPHHPRPIDDPPPARRFSAAR